MYRLKIFTLIIFIALATTLIASNWKTSSQTSDMASAQAAAPAADEEVETENVAGADQANKVSNTGVDVTESRATDTEGSDPNSDANFSFDTEKDPAAAGGTTSPDKGAAPAQDETAKGAPAPNAPCLIPFSNAPADFDDKTNGFIPQPTFDADKVAFEEREEITPDGLGPVYNAQACSECHQNPVTGAISQINELRAGHNVRVNSPWGLVTIFKDAPGGSLINDRSIPTANTLTPPFFGAKLQERVPPLLTAAVVSGPALKREEKVRTFRTSLNTLGDGFVESVPDGTLLAISFFQNIITGGAIRGQAIAVPVLEANINTNPDCANPNLPCKRRIGRFGWKDQHASLLSFSGDAYRNEMGITNFLVRVENTSLGRSVAAFDPVPDPPPFAEDQVQDFKLFAEFMRATKAPPRDPDIINQFNASIVRGRKLFSNMPPANGDNARYSCATCHIPALVTAPPCTVINNGHFTVPVALGNKVFRPFSDFLLHDVGTGDGIVQNGPQDDTVPARWSTRNKVRTPPLWGVRTRDRLMHDGNSLTFMEAIMTHAGEASSVITRFNALPVEVGGVCFGPSGCKEDIIRFLESL